MKLKFINCLLAVAMIGGAAQFLTSCKDNNEDEVKNLELQNSRLADRVTQNEQDLTNLGKDLAALKDSIQKNITSCSCAGKGYVTSDDVATYVNAYVDSVLKANPGTGGITQEQVDSLINVALGESTTLGSITNITNQVDSALNAVMNDSIKNLTDYFLYLERTLNSLQGQLDNLDIPGSCGCDLTALNTFMNTWSPKLGDIEKDATNAWAKAQSNKGEIDSLGNILNKLVDLPTNVAALKDSVDNVKIKADQAYSLAVSNLAAAKSYTDSCLTSLRGGYEGTLQDLADAIANGDKELADSIAANTTKINDLNTEVSNLKDEISVLKTKVTYLENRISSIIIQGVENPVLGYLSTPLGINANILMAYAGSYNQDVTLPNYMPSLECNTQEWWGSEAGFKYMMETVNQSTVKAGEYIIERDGNLGKVWFTVNPSNIDLEGKTFAIVNSQGTALPIELRNIKPSTTLLTHGYSRTIATSANGFYEADATVVANSNALGKLRIEIEPGLVSAFKEVAHDMKEVFDTKQIPAGSKQDILTLGKKIYQQIDGFIPAIGLRGAWLEDDKAFNVTSNYGMAATVFRPLSFKTLKDIANPDRHLPEIDLGKLRDKFNFSFNIDHITLPGLDLNIQVKPIEITIDSSDMNFDFDFDLNFNDIDLSLGDINTDIALTGLDEVTMTIVIPNFPYDADAEGTVIKGGGPNGEDIVDITVTMKKDTQKFEDVTANLSNVGDKIAQPITDKLKEVVDKINKSLNEDFKEQLSSSINSQLSDKINEQINAQLKANLDKIFSKVSTQINSQIQDMIDGVVADIQKEFDKYIGNLETNINDQLDNLVSQINSTLGDKINGLFDRVESSRFYDALQSMINRVNLFIQDPNHYLQVLMLYKADGSYGRLSTSKAVPSQMKLAGGNALLLIPTTYTAETVTPAYKKYVFVSNVFKTSDYSVNAQAGNEACRKLQKKANGENHMNEAFDGDIRKLALNLDGGAGYTYEIVYQALDYSGYTSTMKYYISVR